MKLGLVLIAIRLDLKCSLWLETLTDTISDLIETRPDWLETWLGLALTDFQIWFGLAFHDLTVVWRLALKRLEIFLGMSWLTWDLSPTCALKDLRINLRFAMTRLNKVSSEQREVSSPSRVLIWWHVQVPNNPVLSSHDISDQVSSLWVHLQVLCQVYESHWLRFVSVDWNEYIPSASDLLL